MEEEEIERRLALSEEKIKSLIRRTNTWWWRAWVWITGNGPRCLDYSGPEGAYCKRRCGHFGKHRTSSGLRW